VRDLAEPPMCQEHSAGYCGDRKITIASSLNVHAFTTQAVVLLACIDFHGHISRNTTIRRPEVYCWDLIQK